MNTHWTSGAHAPGDTGRCRAAAHCCPALSLPGGGAAQTLDYAAIEQLFGEPVTISVTGSPLRASDCGLDADHDADEIRRSGARDLSALLRHVAGVRRHANHA